jgi:[citrate (pro-3S)-lyase] ligase
MFGFECRIVERLDRYERPQVEALLQRNGLIFEGRPECIAVAEGLDEKIAATASLEDGVIKMVAVSDEWQGSGLAGTVISKLTQYAAEHGIFHLFIFTKPDMAGKFTAIGYSELAHTERAVLLESGMPSVAEYRNMLRAHKAKGVCGASVMNCDPFTLGHRHLIETTAKHCDTFYVIVVQEDASAFPFKDRINLVRRGTEDISNVVVLPSGDYAVSRATFPTYFLKDRAADAVTATQAELDATLFANVFVPALSLKKRFVGTEPFSPATHTYNEMLKKVLPAHGVEVVELPRIADRSGKAVSASRVREAIKNGNEALLEDLLPEVTLDYLASEDGETAAEALRLS